MCPRRKVKNVLSCLFGSSNKIQMIGILLSKLFCPTVRKNSFSDQEKLLKFESEGREFAKKIDH